MKRDKWDAAFSRLVRLRSNWTCEKCGKVYSDPSPGLHCSHFVTRSRKSTRWDPRNAAAHCYSCHQHLGGNPLLFAEWIHGYLGPHTTDVVRQNSLLTVKWRKADKDELYEQMKEELARIENCRNKGLTTYLDFDLPKVREMQEAAMIQARTRKRT